MIGSIVRSVTGTNDPAIGQPASRRWLFTADWREAVFIHFAIDPAILQRAIPLPLDVRDGCAVVSLVAFTQANLRPTIGGRLGAWLSCPLARHEFLNLRTYVRVGRECGIYFIAEWIPNRVAVLIGPRTYGLPYRLGRLNYRWDATRRRLTGDVRAAAADGRASLRYEAAYGERFDTARVGSLDEFLIERYVAFTCREGVCRRFRVDHAPWPQQRIDVRLPDQSILTLAGDWHRQLRFIGANGSPGVSDVMISAPRVIMPRSGTGRWCRGR